ncbi:MAG: hypothetical protein EA390_14890, partial [Balneolaceae bacterium]
GQRQEEQQGYEFVFEEKADYGISHETLVLSREGLTPPEGIPTGLSPSLSRKSTAKRGGTSWGSWVLILVWWCWEFGRENSPP